MNSQVINGDILLWRFAVRRWLDTLPQLYLSVCSIRHLPPCLFGRRMSVSVPLEWGVQDE
ncbi:hypothetical protein C0J08_16760 [Marinomonas sp. CT5]|uniref:hypothetical protein n=1 Tax=Marinomonas sp. CT5 TaxID=2066133 RepID=UPI001BB0CB5E|nr:hypothetical protein [Marinomonas sp. CT5]QUX96953.1 hypothetical protein C0J08_16760 [Marinomonas sp. CT5]